MHSILFVLRLIFGRDFLRANPQAQLAVRCDGRLQGVTEPETPAGSFDLASWLTFRPSQQPARRVAGSSIAKDGVAENGVAGHKPGPPRPVSPPRKN